MNRYICNNTVKTMKLTRPDSADRGKYSQTGGIAGDYLFDNKDFYPRSSTDSEVFMAISPCLSVCLSRRTLKKYLSLMFSEPL